MEEVETAKSVKSKGFSIFSIYSNRLRARSSKDYNAFTSKKEAKKQVNIESVLEDNGESFELKETQQDDFVDLEIKTKRQLQTANENVTKHVFGEQIKQLNELEDRSQSSKLLRDDEDNESQGTSGEHLTG